jgi:hypothetical protein
MLENLKGRDYFEDICVDERIILEWLFGQVWEDLDWMHLVQNRDKWQVFVNTVMNLQV